MPKKKSPAQLEREITAALAPKTAQHPMFGKPYKTQAEQRCA